MIKKKKHNEGYISNAEVRLLSKKNMVKIKKRKAKRS